MHTEPQSTPKTAMSYPVQSEQFGEEEILGSRNHAYLQTILGAELLKLEQFTVYTELSLDINGKEYKPDVALYPLAQQPQDFLEDELRMTEMPLCAIEILSPRQFMESITDKFKVYFAAGIQSCWLVIPTTRMVLVYSDMHSITPFNVGQVVDEVLDIQLPLPHFFKSV